MVGCSCQSEDWCLLLIRNSVFLSFYVPSLIDEHWTCRLCLLLSTCPLIIKENSVFLFSPMVMDIRHENAAHFCLPLNAPMGVLMYLKITMNFVR